MSDTALNIDSKLLPAYIRQIEDKGAYFVFRFRGKMLVESVDKERPKMNDLIKKHGLLEKHLLCDLSGLLSGDTSSVAAAITRLAELKKKGKKMVFFNVPQPIKDIIEISKVTDLFLITDSESDAAQLIR